MNTLLKELLLMPIHLGLDPIITTTFKWEIYKYVAVGDPEDPEIEDVCNEVTVSLNVPRISFLEYIDLLQFYKKKEWYNNHYITSKIEPLIWTPNNFWFYFDSKYDNFLYTESERKRGIVVYYLEEFSQYAVIDLKI